MFGYMDLKSNTAIFGSTEQIFFRFGGAVSDEFFLIYNILEVLVDSFDGLDQLFTLKVSEIKREIEKIGKEGTDVSKIKSDVENLKSVFSSPEVQMVSKFIKDTNKKIEEYLTPKTGRKVIQKDNNVDNKSHEDDIPY